MKTKILAALLITISLHARSEENLRFNNHNVNYNQFENIKVNYNISYSNYSRENKLDIYNSFNKNLNKPVIIMVHGGAWLVGDKQNTNVIKNKVNYFVGDKDYIFVSVNYRMEKNNIHPQEVSDVADAISWVHKNIKNYGGDPTKIILMGHSAGAHLVSLIGTDEKYLINVGTPMSSIKGIISLDTGSYDLNYLLKNKEIKQEVGKGFFNRRELKKTLNIYEMAWGQYDDMTLIDASPISHINRNEPPFLLISSSENDSHVIITNRFQQFLEQNKSIVYRKDYSLKHEEINDFVGLKNHDLTYTAQKFISENL